MRFRETVPVGSFQIEISADDACPYRVHVLSELLRPLRALGTAQVVLLKGGEFVFIHYHAQVVTFQIVMDTQGDP
jgi:hypothetical protein